MLGQNGNAWNNATVAAAGTSGKVDIYNSHVVSIFGRASAATTITVRWSANNINFYGSETISAGAGVDFAFHVQSGARYIQLTSSAAATITATISAKG